MTLTIDQRLNVHVLLGFLECTSLAETRLVWRMMDRLMLDDTEKAEIEFQVIAVNGGENYAYNPHKSIPVREFEFSKPEMRQVERALEPDNLRKARIPVRARMWLEPLLSQLPSDWLERVAEPEMMEAR